LELQLKVFEPVSEVDASEFIAAYSMVELVSWPHEAASQGHLFKAIHLQVPASLGLVVADLF